MPTVALLGSGLLGTGFVENLLAKGNTVRIWNRTASKLEALAAQGAIIAASPADAVSGADRVHLVLSEDSAVDSVLAAAQSGIGAGVPVFDHSTNRPDRVAERYARLRADGVHYVHCPVFMAPSNARAATGIMLFAGPAAEAETYAPLLSTMTGKVWFCGEQPERAAVYKLLGNAMIIALTGMMGDVLAIGAEAGMDPAMVNELFTHFNPGNMLPVVGQRIVRSEAGDASFTLEMARKDIRLMIESAGERPLTVLPGVAAAMDEAIGDGKGLKDFAVFALGGAVIGGG